MSDAKPSSPGTWGKPIYYGCHATYVEHQSVCQYEAFTFHHDYKNFSLEEHRLADYEQLNAHCVTAPNSRHSNGARAELSNSERLRLLRGKGVEIRVGPTNSPVQTWCLPVTLISHHSLYFKTACMWDTKGQINLPEHDPTVFSLFVEWMYYGSYDVSALPRHPSIDAKCWVLGDYLLSREFKEYAFNRLFGEHVATPFGHAVSFEDVQYVCSNASLDSKLIQFYMDFVADHFSNLNRLHGDMTDWEGILQNHPDIRSRLLQVARYGQPATPHLKNISDYLEPEDLSPESSLRVDTDFAGLALGKKEDMEPTSKDESEKKKNDQFSFNFKAAPFVPDPPSKNNSAPVQGPTVDGNNTSITDEPNRPLDAPENGNGKRLSPSGSTSTDD